MLYFRKRDSWLVIAAFDDSMREDERILVEFDGSEPPVGKILMIVMGDTQKGKEYIKYIVDNASEEIGTPNKKWVKISNDAVSPTERAAINQALYKIKQVFW